jgi:hypothetical protein
MSVCNQALANHHHTTTHTTTPTYHKASPRQLGGHWGSPRDATRGHGENPDGGHQGLVDDLHNLRVHCGDEEGRGQGGCHRGQGQAEGVWQHQGPQGPLQHVGAGGSGTVLGTAAGDGQLRQGEGLAAAKVRGQGGGGRRGFRCGVMARWLYAGDQQPVTTFTLARGEYICQGSVRRQDM